jgi:hypothetical protein
MKSKTLSRFASPAEQLQKQQLQPRPRNPPPRRLAPEAPNLLKKNQNQAKPRLQEKAPLQAKGHQIPDQNPESVAETATSTTNVAEAAETQEIAIATATVIADAVVAEAEMTEKRPNQRFPQMMF